MCFQKERVSLSKWVDPKGVLSQKYLSFITLPEAEAEAELLHRLHFEIEPHLCLTWTSSVGRLHSISHNILLLGGGGVLLAELLTIDWAKQELEGERGLKP